MTLGEGAFECKQLCGCIALAKDGKYRIKAASQDGTALYESPKLRWACEQAADASSMACPPETAHSAALRVKLSVDKWTPTVSLLRTVQKIKDALGLDERTVPRDLLPILRDAAEMLGLDVEPAMYRDSENRKRVAEMICEQLDIDLEPDWVEQIQDEVTLVRAALLPAGPAAAAAPSGKPRAACMLPVRLRRHMLCRLRTF